MTVTIALFTRDLRVHDNPVLTAAHRSGDAVVPMFVVDGSMIVGVNAAPNRLRFLEAALRELDEELRGLGGRLILRRGKVADEVERVVSEVQARIVHIAAEVSHYGRRREHTLRERLAEHDCRLLTHAASVTSVDPADLRPSSGRDHFAVFGPYFRRWESAQRRTIHGAPHRLTVPEIESESLAYVGLDAGTASPQLQVGGETTGRKLLRRWLSGPIADYADRSNELSADATSRLSSYLHFGCLSSAEVISRVDMSQAGGHGFARQMAWRDFHHQILAARPDAAWADYRPGRIEIRDDPQAFDAWVHGRTGFPIIDAPMRQLRAEGWMPGRARLITASFLTKTLRIDWRKGADHFRYWLVDGDVANNQMNWQWAAGTGNDTRLNRRLNPMRQAQRFDPDGVYVRRWLPELSELSGDVHRPWRAGVAPAIYPLPIVEVPGM